MQTVAPSSSGLDLLSFISSTVITNDRMYIGGIIVGPNPLTDWLWVDGTNSRNLNCFTAGCMLWSSGEAR